MSTALAMNPSDLARLRGAIRGTVVTRDESGYDDLRRVWNAMVDRRPALFVRPAERGDVREALAFALAHDLPLSVRGAGHNIAGTALCDGGLTIDFGAMRGVGVDPSARRARVQPGATLGDFDAAAQAHGLATPIGINSTTGIAGLTLGGGFGWITRKYGMTVDNLVSARVVTADGREQVASADQNPDLFWAIRGGGGNFGIVTEFEYALHRVGPDITTALVVFPFAQARTVLARYREFAAQAPEETTAWAVLRKAPPLPFLPADVHGREVVIIPLCHIGDPREGERRVGAVRAFGEPAGVHAGTQPYRDWQQAFDPLLTPGARNYWKSHNFTELSDGVLDTVVDYAGRLPTPHCEIFIGHIAGAANRVAPDAMAYGHRDARFVMNVHGRWDDAADDSAGIGWSRAFFDAAKPYASSGAYTNFMTEDEGARIGAAYGSNYARLVELKRRYDPKNVFRHNQNIRP